jgi:acyl-coenzyme A synthetase/AMP-(fatty) acid ligase
MWDFRKFGEATAIIDENEQRFSYAFLDEQGQILADKVGGRKLVFCLCSNTIGSVLGYTAFLNHRIVPVMLDANMDKEWLSALVERFKPDYLWKPSETAAIGYCLEKTPYEREFPPFDELALLLTTSGSTGSPKFVRQSYANIRANTESIVAYLKLDAAERPITTLPMSYTYGLSIINSHLWVGASILLQKTLMQKKFWTQFADYEATSFGGVPYTYEMLDKLNFFQMELPSLRTMTQAGGKIAPALQKKFSEYALENGKNFVVMYGQTEATARMSYLPPEKSIEKNGSIGIAVPNGALSLIDNEGKEITAPDIVGELVYKGENVTLGYAERGEDLMKGDERKGVLVTGDMARRDRDGYYYIAGRKKRFLKMFGSRVNLDETERLIREAFPSIDVACGGVDDKMSIFTTDESLKREIVMFLFEKTGISHAAFDIVAVENIPRMESGKILYSELSKL